MVIKQHTLQLIRYGIVGVVSNALAYLVYIFITLTGVSPEATAGGIYLVAASISYLGNYKWTFSSKTSHTSTLPRFIMIHILGFLAQLLLISYLYRVIGLGHQLAQLITIVCVATILFCGSKYYVYPQQDNRSSRFGR